MTTHDKVGVVLLVVSSWLVAFGITCVILALTR